MSAHPATASGYYLLLRAMDHVWRDRNFELRDRLAARRLLWNLYVNGPPGSDLIPAAFENGRRLLEVNP